MRNPQLSVKRMPRANLMGKMVRSLLEKAIDLWPSLQVAAAQILRGDTAEAMDSKVVCQVRQSVLLLLSGHLGERNRTAKADTPLQASVIEAWGRAIEDPDAEVLAEWLDHGAPLGYTQPIPTRGVFPRVDGIEWKEQALMNLTRSLQGWQNYSSATEEATELEGLVADYVKRGFCRVVDTEEEAKLDLGRPPVLNKLGVVVKYNGEKKKCRVIWDLRESGANTHCSQGERIVLPRLLDLATLAVQKYRRRRSPWIAAVDIRDAFMNIPAGKDKFVTTAAIPRKQEEGHSIVIFDTLVFGAVSSPTIWGRMAAFLGRSWASVCPEVGTQIYVDDPAFILEGNFDEAARSLTTILLWASVLGFPIKWEKACGGKSITWVGACITLLDETSEVEVSIPADKVEKVQQQTQEFLSRPVIGFRKLRTYAGGLSFIAGLIPHLRPFLTSIWAALSGACTASDGGGLARTAGKLVHTRRVRPALLWIAALVAGDPAPLVRVLPAWHSKVEAEITTDASPFGLGGVLRIQGCIRAAFGIDIPTTALEKFKASRGDCKYNTTWEGLALLVAFRLWLPNHGFGASLRCKSDNTGALYMLANGKAKSPELNVLAREFALDQALRKYRLGWLKHIPGITNLEADALSRLHAPIPATLPDSLKDIRLVDVHIGQSFWLVSSY